jgi:haloacetate dehalogenase
MLALWGAQGIPSETTGPLSIWQRWATTVTGAAIDCGHYLPEENPQATAKALLDFFSAH